MQTPTTPSNGVVLPCYAKHSFKQKCDGGNSEQQAPTQYAGRHLADSTTNMMGCRKKRAGMLTENQATTLITYGAHKRTAPESFLSRHTFCVYWDEVAIRQGVQTVWEQAEWLDVLLSLWLIAAGVRWAMPIFICSLAAGCDMHRPLRCCLLQHCCVLQLPHPPWLAGRVLLVSLMDGLFSGGRWCLDSGIGLCNTSRLCHNSRRCLDALDRQSVQHLLDSCRACQLVALNKGCGISTALMIHVLQCCIVCNLQHEAQPLFRCKLDWA